MLETIDQTDWAALHDAYGPSTRTPRLIRSLASGIKWKRDKALFDLYSTINHQGTIYAASVAAVPYLLEIVGSKEVPDRTPALQLLQGVSTGTSYHEAHASMFFHREKSKTPEWQEQVKEEKGWVTEIHSRIKAGVPRIVDVLRLGRLEERVAAASLLATLPDSPEAQEALLVAASDPEATVSAAAITAIGGQETPMDALKQCFERASDDLVRTVAAVQILFQADGTPPPAVVEHLLNHLRSPQAQLRKAYESLPDVGAFLGDVGQALAAGPHDAVEAAFPLLFEQVKQSPYSLNYSESLGLLVVAMMLKPPPDRKWVASDLTPEQRQTIRLIADRAWRIERGVPTTSGNIVDLLQQVGLPGKREEIFQLLAGTPEGVQTPKEERKWSGKKRRPWWKFF